MEVDGGCWMCVRRRNWAHLAVQGSVGQLPPRLLDDLADFLQLFLCLRCFVLRLLLLPAIEAQFSKKDISKKKNFFFKMWP